MGLLDDYVDSGIDFVNDVQESTFDVPDGLYEFSVGDAYIQDGSKANPEYKAFCLKYLLNTEDGEHQYTYTERFAYPKVAGQLTDGERTRLSIMKGRLLKLGVPEEELNTFGPEDVTGITGTLTLKTKAGTTFQNIVAFNVDEDQSQEAVPTPVKAKPVAKAPTRKPAAKTAPKPKPAPEPVEEAEAEATEEAGETIETEADTTAAVEEAPGQSLRERIAARKAQQAQGAAGRPNPLAKRG